MINQNSNKPISRTMNLLLAALLLLAVSNISAQTPEILTNAQIVKLTKAGLGTATIVNKIRRSKSKFDLSTDALILLKREKVADEVIDAMTEVDSPVRVAAAQNVPKTAPQQFLPSIAASTGKSGIYWDAQTNNRQNLKEIEPTIFRKAKTGGMLASALTYGIAKMKTKATFPGAHSSLQIPESKPVFYFYTTDSAKNFSLVRLEDRKDQRKITMDEGNIFGTESGIRDSVVVPFDYEKLADGVYKVTPKNALAAGEYGFFLGSMTTQAYDFGIVAPKP